MVTREQGQEQIVKLQDKIKYLREHGTEIMSKTGVKWCVSTHRDTIKRLRAELRTQ